MIQRRNTLFLLLNIIFLAGCGDVEPEIQFTPDSPTIFQIFTEDSNGNQTPLQRTDNKYQCKTGSDIIVELRHRGGYHRYLATTLTLNNDQDPLPNKSKDQHVERFILNKLSQGEHTVTLKTEVQLTELTSLISQDEQAKLNSDLILLIEVKK